MVSHLKSFVNIDIYTFERWKTGIKENTKLVVSKTCYIQVKKICAEKAHSKAQNDVHHEKIYVVHCKERKSKHIQGYQ